MRYLNKIVFINSAHIPYAEIKLDGNVHFIGTQGVGKSTLLRAILSGWAYGLRTSRRAMMSFISRIPIHILSTKFAGRTESSL